MKKFLVFGVGIIAIALLTNVYTHSSDKVLLAAEEEWPKTNFKKRIVDLDEIVSGGPPKDGIPAIDRPKFVGIKQADKWLRDDEPVIVVEIGSTTKAYPLQILIYHEIVNDKIGEIPIAVTFCPLCNASIVFDRRMADKILDFGTTGRLRKSDLIMYDRQTQSWWQQFTGLGIVGEYAGQALTQLSSTIVAYATFKSRYVDGKVLSRQTGYHRPYGTNPYRGYDSIEDQPFLLTESPDDRLPPMTRVLGISIDDNHKIYPLERLAGGAVIHDKLAGRQVVVFIYGKMLSVLDKSDIAESHHVPAAKAYLSSVDDIPLVFEFSGSYLRDRQTGSSWNIFGEAIDGKLKGKRLKSIDSGVHFAFAWLAFRPNSDVFSSTDN